MKIVTVKTKSKFNNLNGKPLEVVEIVGKRVSCKVFDDNIQRPITIDFHIKEVVEFKK